MTDKPAPAKDAGRTDSTGQKRPHATLDLKATEVRPQAPVPDAAAPAPAAAASSSAASSSGGSVAGPATSATAVQPAASGTQSAAKDPAAAKDAAAVKDPAAKAPGAFSGGSSSAKPEPQNGAAKTTVKAAPTSRERTGSGVGRFLSHFAAGVIGGGVVYAGAALLERGGLPFGQQGASSLTERVAALESLSREGGAMVSDAGTKIADMERRLAALDEAHGALRSETQSLTDAAKTGDGANAERLQRLEDQLSMMAAGAQGSDGRVPQLAAITGKISDVETSLRSQIDALRNSLPDDVEQRVAAAQSTSEAAKSAMARLDRELAQVRTDQARVDQRAEATKAETDRLAAAVTAAKEETGKLSSTLNELRSSIDAQLKSTVKPADVSAAVDPVAGKLAALQQSVQDVVKSEESRKENAERIVLSLELSNLKRALDRGAGHGYAAELEEVRKASAGQLDLAALERFRETGVATAAELKEEFRPLMNAVIDADIEPADGSVIDRLLAGAKSVVRVRKINHEAGDTSVEAIVARIEAALAQGRLGNVLTEARSLPQRAQTPLDDWLIKVTARDSVDEAIASVESRLKASLAGEPPAVPAAADPAKN